MKQTIMMLFMAMAAVGCGNKSGYTSVDADTFAQVISDHRIQLVDVRTPQEYAEGHIPGAVNIDVKSDDFDARITQLRKSHPVAVYCRSGRRSKMAAQRIATYGYRVTELNEGILSWQGEVEK
ncbi:MAG: rhodanese-like domain-containing protein [Bacteroidaceae bacterium]|nr:rhodanese-like domain-containing protein [Bacteroidaceae bacterium]